MTGHSPGKFSGEEELGKIAEEIEDPSKIKLGNLVKSYRKEYKKWK